MIIQETRAIYHLDNLRQFRQVPRGSAVTVHANWIDRPTLELAQAEILERDIIVFVENCRNNGKRAEKHMFLKHIVSAIEGFKNVFICYDLAHAMINQEPIEEVAKYKNYIKHIHLTDTNLFADRHWPLYKGSLDIDKFMRILGEIDYKGVINIERWEGISDRWGEHSGDWAK